MTDVLAIKDGWAPLQPDSTAGSGQTDLTWINQFQHSRFDVVNS